MLVRITGAVRTCIVYVRALSALAGLLNTLVAYTGTFRVQGDKLTTMVEVAWNPEWVGTEQTRTFKVDGDRLEVSTPWRVMPNMASKGMTRSVVTFVRSK